ncbi:hypothetical protein PRNP1_005175 [Phytophthora ramorum]
MPRSSASFLRRWRLLVGTEAALTCVADCLTPRETVCLLVFALDAQYEPLARFLYAHAHLLSLGDARRRFTSVLHCAAAHGCAEVVQWLLRFRLSHSTLLTGEKQAKHDVWEAQNASKQGKTLAWISRNTPYKFPAEVMHEAARQGDQEVVQWLHCCCQYEKHRAMEYAASAGRLEVVMWLHEQEQKKEQKTTDVDVFMVQPLESKLQVVNWVAVFPARKCFREVFASRAGLLAGVYDQRDPLLPWEDAEALATSLGRRRYPHGNIKTLQYLHKDMRMPLDPRTLEAAIGSGHLELVKYITERIPIEKRYSLSPTAAEKAAASGNLALLAFVVEQLVLWSPQMLIAAASTGNVKMAKWVAERSDSPSSEAKELKLPRERRDRAATSNAIDAMLPGLSSVEIKRRSSYDNLTSVESSRPVNIVDGSTLYRCASLGHFSMIEWLLQRGLASPTFSLSMKEREIVLRSVVGRGITDEDAIDVTALSGRSSGELNGGVNAAAEPPTTAVTAAVIATANANDGPIIGVPRIAGVRSNTDEKRAGFESFAWALPCKTSPYWQTKFVRLAVQYCPESSSNLEWMPLWAAQRGELDVLKQLYSVKHPQLFTHQTFTAIMRYTKAGDVLQWFQTHSATLMGDSSIVEWGVKYRQFSYLTYVFLKFQPVRTEERFRRHGVEYALHVACAMGHLDVVTWICGNCEIFLKVPASELHAKLGRLTIWNDALIAAARCGQIRILVWLHEKFTFLRKVPDSPRKMTLVGAMADAAAGYGQLRVLRWLQATVAPQMVYQQAEPKAAASQAPAMVETSFVSTEGLLEAMVNRQVDVVQWVCAVDIDLVARQTATRRGELVTFLREEADGFVSSKLAFIFPPL